MALDLGISREEKLIVFVMLAAGITESFTSTLLSPAFPAIMAEFSVDAPAVQWLTSGYSMVEAVIMPLSAYFLGRFTTRRLMVVSMAIFTLSSALAAWAPAFPVLLLARALQATATGVIVPMLFTLMLVIFPVEKRGLGMGMVSLVLGTAPAIGPAISGAIVDTLGWHVLFWLVTALATLIWIVIATKMIPYGSFDPATFDIPSVVLSFIGLLCVLYGFSMFSTTPEWWITAVIIVIGVIAIGLFVRRQLTLPVPLLEIRVLKTRAFAVALITVGVLQGTQVATSVVNPLFIQQVLGYNATASGLVMLPCSVLGALAGFVAGSLFDRWGIRKTAVPGIIAMFGAAIALACMNPDFNIIALASILIPFSIGLQFVFTPINTWGVNALPNRLIQHATALNAVFIQVGVSLVTALVIAIGALAPAVAPEASAQELLYLGNHIEYIVIAVIGGLVFLTVVFLARDRRRTPSDSDQ